MGSIQEEEDMEEEEVGGDNLHRMLMTGSMGSIPEQREEEEEGEGQRKGVEAMFSMESVEKDYFKSMQDEVGPPVVQPPELMSPLHHMSSPTRSPLVWGSRSPSPRVVSSSPEFSPLSSPSHSPYVNRGRVPRSASLSPPPPLAPPPKNTPKVDVDLELQTLMNGEGRISLLALLHAIANFPQSEEVWTEEVGERCFSLIQLCLDMMPPPQKDDTLPKPAAVVSGTERRKRFFKQDNKAFNKLSTETEKPWKVHSRQTIKFAANALIQCGTCGIIGCTIDTCRLKQFHLAPPHGMTAHNRLTRSLRRIHLHSPATFRQALIEFSQPSMSSCRRVFKFLHVVLQYCMHGGGGGGEVCFNHLLASVIMAVMRVTVDRLVQLDITEPSIQEVSVSASIKMWLC